MQRNLCTRARRKHNMKVVVRNKLEDLFGYTDIGTIRLLPPIVEELGDFDIYCSQRSSNKQSLKNINHLLSDSRAGKICVGYDPNPIRLSCMSTSGQADR